MCPVAVMPGRLFLVATALLCCARAQPARPTEESMDILTFVGETVVLPCQIELAASKEVPSVEWSKDGMQPNISFLYRHGCETFEEKNPVFRYRTSLFMEQLKDGNVSLRISNVRLSDAGKYKCRRIPRVPQDASTINLVVGAVSEPRLSVVPGAAVVLQCEASCWFPLPEVTLLDALGHDLSADDPKSVQDSSSGCFNVTRRATVQTGNRFTCRVHQSKINQTRVMEIYIPDECTRSCIPYISVAVVVTAIILILIFAFAFLCWKSRNSEEERKLLSTQSSHRSSTCSNAEGQNLRSQTSPVQNATSEHQREVDELRDKDEIIRRLNEELQDLRSKQSPVECHHDQPTIYRNPSKSSQGVSKPIDLPPKQVPQDINPKPAASTNSNRFKSGNFSQNKDSKPNVSIQIPVPNSQIPRSSHNNDTPDVLTNSGNVSPAAYPTFPAEGSHAGRSRSMSVSLPHSNSAKAQRRYSISARLSNRFSVLENLPEDGSEPLL